LVSPFFLVPFKSKGPFFFFFFAPRPSAPSCFVPAAREKVFLPSFFFSTIKKRSPPLFFFPPLCAMHNYLVTLLLIFFTPSLFFLKGYSFNPPFPLPFRSCMVAFQFFPLFFSRHAWINSSAFFSSPPPPQPLAKFFFRSSPPPFFLVGKRRFPSLFLKKSSIDLLADLFFLPPPIRIIQ